MTSYKDPMLTKKQNLLETIRGGKPDRFVNQFESMKIFWADPVNSAFESCQAKGRGSETVDGWGVTWRWSKGTQGPFPVHKKGYKVLNDITKWKDVIKHPPIDYPKEAWETFLPEMNVVDRNEQFLGYSVFPGVFELLHCLMGMDDCLINFYEEPEAMHELIHYITEYYCKYAELVCNYFKIDCLFQSDDWGSQSSSFLSPQMFNEFIVPAYKKIYQTWRDNGVELIVHHNDSYSANLVPYMIEMGIDIWQGCLTTNNVVELVKKYGGQISFMGDLNNGVIDIPYWTEDLVAREVRRACISNGKHYFIPCLTQAVALSAFEGVYECVSKYIDIMSNQIF